MTSPKSEAWHGPCH